MPLPTCATIVLAPGETVVSYTSGGGGYGPPRERPAEKVLRDVAEGRVTRERAREVYGVVLDADGAVDEAATARRRAEL